MSLVREAGERNFDKTRGPPPLAASVVVITDTRPVGEVRMRNVVSIAAGESKVKEIRVTETGPGLLDQRSVRRPGSRKRKLVERARRQEREGLELSLSTGWQRRERLEGVRPKSPDQPGLVSLLLRIPVLKPLPAHLGAHLVLAP